MDSSDVRTETTRDFIARPDQRAMSRDGLLEKELYKELYACEVMPENTMLEIVKRLLQFW